MMSLVFLAITVFVENIATVRWAKMDKNGQRWKRKLRWKREQRWKRELRWKRETQRETYANCFFPPPLSSDVEMFEEHAVS